MSDFYPIEAGSEEENFILKLYEGTPLDVRDYARATLSNLKQFGFIQEEGEESLSLSDKGLDYGDNFFSDL